MAQVRINHREGQRVCLVAQVGVDHVQRGSAPVAQVGVHNIERGSMCEWHRSV